MHRQPVQASKSPFWRNADESQPTCMQVATSKPESRMIISCFAHFPFRTSLPGSHSQHTHTYTHMFLLYICSHYQCLVVPHTIIGSRGSPFIMADAPDAPKAASLLSVLLQLPADVVENNIIKIIGHVGMCSLMLCSREAAAVVRRSRSTLTLRVVNGDELTLQQVQDRVAQLGLYTSVHALTLVAGQPDDVTFLMVSTTMPCMAAEAAYMTQRQVPAPGNNMDVH